MCASTTPGKASSPRPSSTTLARSGAMLGAIALWGATLLLALALAALLAEIKSRMLLPRQPEGDARVDARAGLVAPMRGVALGNPLGVRFAVHHVAAFCFAC